MTESYYISIGPITIKKVNANNRIDESKDIRMEWYYIN